MQAHPTFLATELVQLFKRLDPSVDARILALLPALVQANQAGHVCLPLTRPADRLALSTHPLVGQPGDYKPLILDTAGRLYFAHHWFDEQRLAQYLRLLARQSSAPDVTRLRDLLTHYFPDSGDNTPNQQKLAAALAVRQHFMVISGGPGTGKTTTVVKLLALLASLSERPLVMKMAAPTGKAAARLSESVQQSQQALTLSPEVQQQLPQQALTLHRLLGLRPGMGQAHYHAGNPLPLDVLVLDEASMIDLSLMAQTMAALPAQARLILLGDRDQLSSVEAGSVLGDLCQHIHYRPATLAWLAQCCGSSLPPSHAPDNALSDCVAILSHSHRFAADSGVGQLARLVNEGAAAAAWQWLQQPEPSDIKQYAVLDDTYLHQQRQTYWQAVQSAAPLDTVQQAFNRFMLLVAERRQVSEHNQSIEQQLTHTGIKPAQAEWYAGRPVMISENDYSLGLFNGDIGFTVAREAGLRVAFPGTNGQWREFAPNRLPAHETVYAMTVHKSQGSEFNEVCLLLPEQASASLNRALIYTAITRARQRFTVVGQQPIWEQGVLSSLSRHSGLVAHLLADKA